MAGFSYTNDYGDKIWEYFGIGGGAGGGGATGGTGTGTVGVAGGTGSAGAALGTSIAMLIELWKASKSTKNFYDWAINAGYSEEIAKEGETTLNGAGEAVIPPATIDPPAQEETKEQEVLPFPGTTIWGEIVGNQAINGEKVEDKVIADEITGNNGGTEIMPGIEDGGTGTESGELVGGEDNSWMQFVLDMQQKQWEREDAIRAETQAREDNAWQRSVADMRAAGVNPNLVNAGPATSGGGITTATGPDYGPYTENLKASLELIMQQIEHSFQGDQAEKDRLAKLIGNLVGMFSFGNNYSLIEKIK